MFCERQCHHILSSDQQFVGEIAHLWKAISSHLFSWPTACECHCTFVKGSLVTCFLMTNSMWVILHICERQSHHIFSYDQQLVSDIAHLMKASLITCFPMTNRKWVTCYTLWKPVSSHLFIWPTECQWHCTFCESQCQWQSSPLFLQPIGCEWQCAFYERQSHLWPTGSEWHYICCEGTLITSLPMTNRRWVTLHILWNAVSSHLIFLWPTECSEQHHCTSCERRSYHIFYYDQQHVSDIAHSVKVSLITSFPVTNSEYVAL